MNTWLEAGSTGASGGILPGYWPGPQPDGSVAGGAGSVKAWAGLIKVDGTSYTWMGAAGVNGVVPPSVTQDHMEYTSTRSTFLMTVAGKVSMNITFLSPLTPDDIRRQSVIGTYLYVSVKSLDGATHVVELYCDTSAEWTSIHKSDTAQWNYTVNDGIGSHRSWRQDQSEFNADYADDQAHWGYWLWSTKADNGMTYQSGQDSVVRGNFLNNGSLPNTQDTVYRAIEDAWPVFGFANNLGNVGSTPVETLYTIVHAQENAIIFLGEGGLRPVPSLWASYWDSDISLVTDFYNDWSMKWGVWDHKIAVDSLAAGGQDYLTITSLSAHQAFGAVQLCGTPDKPYYFLKEISSDGNTQTVDVMFPAMPIFLYSNPALLKYMLDPLYENQEAGHFPQEYSLHDLGANYPRAIGHPTEPMPLEECGNMIIMTLAYSQHAYDTAYLSQHYPLLKQWTTFLVAEALIPANQLSNDDFQGTLANQTNLAQKGIIAIEAMSVIANITGNSADALNYTNIAHDYLTQWEKLAIVPATASVPAHTKLAYQDNTGHGLLYNLYADTLLKLNFVPKRIYDMQSEYYPTIANVYGVQLDSRNPIGKCGQQQSHLHPQSPCSSPSLQHGLVLLQLTAPSPIFTILKLQTGGPAPSSLVQSLAVISLFLQFDGSPATTPNRESECEAKCSLTWDAKCDTEDRSMAVRFKA
ncbi:hypothetical protein BOTNAR_0386g00010 [Botryotinia narcissicola]|uniref:Glutaminase A n=1 Tax=Botryotinia narcissicola TaxID=278944 RepID=A0A4Z1HP77_9HELO|nr:hypothetical protein BOTNAR_0386g00010 [Botryotinia narcissicola]